MSGIEISLSIIGFFVIIFGSIYIATKGDKK